MRYHRSVMRAANQPVSWWGWHWEPPVPLSIVQILQAGDKAPPPAGGVWGRGGAAGPPGGHAPLLPAGAGRDVPPPPAPGPPPPVHPRQRDERPPAGVPRGQLRPP